MFDGKPALAILMLLCAAPALPADPPLRGLPKSFCVAVAELGEETARAGLGEGDLRSAVEGRLAELGFPATKEGLCLEAAVRVSPIRATGLAAYHAELSLPEQVSPSRDPAAKLRAPTWRRAILGASMSAGLKASVAASFQSLAEAFADDYLLANPGR